MAARPWLPPDLSWLQHFTGLTTKRCSLPAGAPPPRAVSDLQLRTSGSLPRRRRLLGLFRRRIPAGLSNAAELKTSSRDGGMIIHLQMDDRTGSEVSPSDALTLSHLTDLWRREKFCPSSERRRSGGEREPFASGVSSCALGCYWELAPPHGDGSGPLVGLALQPVGMEEICSTPFSPSSRHRKSLIPESGHARLVSRLLWHLQVADEQLISAASSRLEEGGAEGNGGGDIGTSMLVYFGIGPISCGVTETLKRPLADHGSVLASPCFSADGSLAAALHHSPARPTNARLI